MDDRPLASRLVGKKVGKWNVVKKREKTADNSGYWSSCYTVKDDSGNLAFMKAYNYTYAFRKEASSADILKFMAENFVYERNLLEFCKEHKMKRVVTAIDSGEYEESGEIIPVPYLVFEIAQGNLKQYQELKNPDILWKLKAFHGALVGLSQLHGKKIVHQDIKPSNILIFGNKYSKISDLGSATQLGNDSFWCRDNHEGDIRYAPIELLYGYFSPNWNTRRFGADLFMMGGLITYMVTDSNFLSLIHDKIPNEFKHYNYGGTFENAKPVIIEAYYKALKEIENTINEEIRKDLLSIIAELSHPIPEERGAPKKLDTGYNQYSLLRYISKIDRLSKTAIRI